MAITKEFKKEIFKNHSNTKQASDTGSPESQIALFTHRIKHITEHLKDNKKDNSSRLQLIKLVGKRKAQLRYLQNEDISRYRNTLKELKLRK